MDVGATMTMVELGVIAHDYVGSDDDRDATCPASMGVQMATGYPLKPLEWNNNSSLVRDCIPHMSKVQCTLLLAAEDTKATATPVEKKPIENNKHKKRKIATEIVDLTSDNDDDDDDENIDTMVNDNDEALARRLQKEELTRASASQQQQQHALAEQSSAPITKSNQNTTSLDDPRDPTTVTAAGDYWIYQDGPAPFRGESVLGKWLLFRPEHQIAAAWKTLATAVQSGQLQAASAKVATRYNCLNNHNGNARNRRNKSPSYVICVYTSEERMDEVGMRLIQLVKHDLHYKTDESTALGHYSNRGQPRVTKTTLYWNHGRPSSTKTVTKLMSAAASRTLAQQAVAVAAATADDWVSFEGRMVTVVGLQHCYYKHKPAPPPLKEGTTAVVLTREPDNTYDANAIQVALPESGQQVGFIQKKQAQVWAPWLDQRGLVQIDEATVVSIVGDSTITVALQGRACPHAKEMLACF